MHFKLTKQVHPDLIYILVVPCRLIPKIQKKMLLGNWLSGSFLLQGAASLLPNGTCLPLFPSSRFFSTVETRSSTLNWETGKNMNRTKETWRDGLGNLWISDMKAPINSWVIFCLFFWSKGDGTIIPENAEVIPWLYCV